MSAREYEKGRGLREVAVVIHALVQDADDIDAVGGEAVEQDMRAAGNFEVARAYVGTALSECRTLHHGLDALPNIAGVCVAA
jgi:hypothetical protein